MLKGKTALVTGSTSGIGLGIAACLAREGATVVLNGFGEIDAARAIVSEFGGATGYHGADVSKPEEIAEMMAYAEAEFGGVDILVNNAGIQYIAPIEEFGTANWDKIIAINLSSSFHTIRLALSGMRKKNWGRVVNISSVHGLTASPYKSAYVAAKHGLVGLTKTVALETATTGITVNAICPGWVLTPLAQKQVEARAVSTGVSVDEAKRQLLAERQPSLQFSTPEEIGELAVYLCSDAASNVRGVAWQIDGGWTAL